VLEKPTFIQGLFAFEGQGLCHPRSFEVPVTYVVPADKRAQTIYFRGGNACAEMIYLVLTVGGGPMRYFPVGAKSSVHVALVVTEDIFPETKLEVLLAAPADVSGSLVIDIGLLEI